MHVVGGEKDWINEGRYRPKVIILENERNFAFLKT
jgi:hypothetical protein